MAEPASATAAAMNSSDLVIVKKKGPITFITINRPKSRNAVNGPTADALTAAFIAFDADSEGKFHAVTLSNDRDVEIIEEDGVNITSFSPSLSLSADNNLSLTILQRHHRSNNYLSFLAKVAILSGAEGTFCAGADLKEMSQRTVR